MDGPQRVFQDHLLERIVKFDEHFHRAHGAAPLLETIPATYVKCWFSRLRIAKRRSPENEFAARRPARRLRRAAAPQRPLRRNGMRQQHQAAEHEQHDTAPPRTPPGNPFLFAFLLVSVLVPFAILSLSGQTKGAGSAVREAPRAHRCCTSSTSYGHAPELDRRLSWSAMANAARGSPSRGWPIDPGFSR